MAPVDHLLLIGSVLVLASVALARISAGLGLPSLLLFIGIGMLAGAGLPEPMRAAAPQQVQSVGIVALVLILFAGGLDTEWKEVRPVLAPAVLLATVGVVVTAGAVGLLTWQVLGIPPLSAFLFASVISCTDAAAVLSVLRSRSFTLRGRLRPLLELESGSNDPMAIFLLVALIRLVTRPEAPVWEIPFLFVLEMGVGAVFGLACGRLIVLGVNRLRAGFVGIYPAFLLAAALFTYAATSMAGGSGFLAVYVAGLIAGNSEFVHKRTLLRFFDGTAWLSQIAMFLALGVLVLPRDLGRVAGPGLFVSGFLILVARPLAVFVSLIGSRTSLREKLFVSWVGLRGAVPIVLATFFLLAGVPAAGFLFEMVFFVVLTSALVQGWSLPHVARLLGVAEPASEKPGYPAEFAEVPDAHAELLDFVVPAESGLIGRPLIDLGLPRDCLVLLVIRNENYIVPHSGTTLDRGDVVLVLADRRSLPAIHEILSRRREPGEDREAA